MNNTKYLIPICFFILTNSAVSGKLFQIPAIDNNTYCVTMNANNTGDVDPDYTGGHFVVTVERNGKIMDDGVGGVSGYLRISRNNDLRHRQSMCFNGNKGKFPENSTLTIHSWHPNQNTIERLLSIKLDPTKNLTALNFTGAIAPTGKKIWKPLLLETNYRTPAVTIDNRLNEIVEISMQLQSGTTKYDFWTKKKDDESGPQKDYAILKPFTSGAYYEEDGGAIKGGRGWVYVVFKMKKPPFNQEIETRSHLGKLIDDHKKNRVFRFTLGEFNGNKIWVREISNSTDITEVRTGIKENDAIDVCRYGLLNGRRMEDDEFGLPCPGGKNPLK